MKSILLSIKPQYVAKILNGDKTIEVRKQFPKKYVGWVYIYCTKDKNNLLHKNCADIWWVEDKDFQKKNKRLGIEQPPILNGTVVARFWCDKVEEINTRIMPSLARRLEEDKKYNFPRKTHLTDSLLAIDLLKLSCLKIDELTSYFVNYETREFGIEHLVISNGYAIHITKLEIFDTPKELGEFYTTHLDKTIPELFDNSIQLPNGVWVKPLTKAPQNYFWVEAES